MHRKRDKVIGILPNTHLKLSTYSHKPECHTNSHKSPDQWKYTSKPALV